MQLILSLSHKPCFFNLQKKAHLALLEQEQAKAREEALHQEKLREEERKISEAFEESKKVCDKILIMF